MCFYYRTFAENRLYDIPDVLNYRQEAEKIVWRLIHLFNVVMMLFLLCDRF